MKCFEIDFAFTSTSFLSNKSWTISGFAFSIAMHNGVL